MKLRDIIDSQLDPRIRDEASEIVDVAKALGMRKVGETDRTLQQIIDATRQRAEPKVFDVFVHGEWPYSAKGSALCHYSCAHELNTPVKLSADALALPAVHEAVEQQRSAYISALSKKMETSRNRLIIGYPGARADYDKLPYDDDETVLTLPEVGTVRGDYIEKLLGIMDGLHHEDSFHIHGSNRARCALQATTVLHTLLTERLYDGTTWDEDDVNVVYPTFDELLQDPAFQRRADSTFDPTARVYMLTDMKPPQWSNGTQMDCCWGQSVREDEDRLAAILDTDETVTFPKK